MRPKLAAYQSRNASAKGQKDKIDILALLCSGSFDWRFFKQTLKTYHQDETMHTLQRLLATTYEVKELLLTQHRFAKIKKKLLGRL